MGEVAQLLSDPTIKDITKESVIYVSSSRIGFGVSNICDNNLSTYWQSNGERPHQITFVFDEPQTLAFVRFYVSQKMDESYTPSKVLLRVGTSLYDLIELAVVTLEEPEGWYYLTKHMKKPLRGSCVQLVIQENCSHGRDSHIRQVQIFGF
ncbi:hypothetical protein ENUP19_0257G0103 [Entamoeba nuttalli]|uniref:Anaphase-promoting complex, subunit 10 (APC10) protein n=2 Tax=Entamoeba nuttalli TaxID=412467 RepID=K2HWK4_ENTNP|nr:Anaphase-promoting complex, subunit 10 (APC10) protein [Entamoeba nuttalli P19]EKE40620.1 Anaphase-promoting complex, subunit 10 (APC10) protein [Entamoeba nuttalli P19]|eukprot:XP_008857045.1 Anaphase-promoting complex, subunit 10 (APC10) protein [Entamoeba nuttalli P19]